MEHVALSRRLRSHSHYMWILDAMSLCQPLRDTQFLAISVSIDNSSSVAVRLVAQVPPTEPFVRRNGADAVVVATEFRSIGGAAIAIRAVARRAIPVVLIQ